MSIEPNEAELKIADEILELDWKAFRPHPKVEFDRYNIAKILAAHRADDEGKMRCSGCGHSMSDHDKHGCWWGCAWGTCEKDPRAESGVANPMPDQLNHAADANTEYDKAIQNQIDFLKGLLTSHRADDDDADELAKALEILVDALKPHVKELTLLAFNAWVDADKVLSARAALARHAGKGEK